MLNEALTLPQPPELRDKTQQLIQEVTDIIGYRTMMPIATVVNAIAPYSGHGIGATGERP